MLNVHKMTRPPQLECFDAPEPRVDSAVMAEPSADWREGHAAGLAEGQALAATEQAALSAEIAQTFADLAFSYVEARAQLMQGLKPLFGALIARVLPGLADPLLTAGVVDLLHQAAERDSSAPLELSVNPGRIDGLTGILPYAVGMPVILIADPDLGPDQAILRSRLAETALDVGAVLTGVQDAIGAIFESAQERVNYG